MHPLAEKEQVATTEKIEQCFVVDILRLYRIFCRSTAPAVVPPVGAVEPLTVALPGKIDLTEAYESHK